MTYFWVTTRMQVWTKHMSQFSSFASFTSVQFWLTCGENICCYSQKSIRHNALWCHCDVELPGYITVNVGPKVLQLITWSTQGTEISPQDRQSAQQLTLSEKHGTSSLNNINGELQLGENWVEKVRRGGKWHGGEKQEVGKFCLNGQFLTAVKAPGTSSSPPWPSMKGEAVEDWAKRIAQHQRNWKNNCSQRRFGPNQVQASRLPPGGQRQYWLWLLIRDSVLDFVLQMNVQVFLVSD